MCRFIVSNFAQATAAQNGASLYVFLPCVILYSGGSLIPFGPSFGFSTTLPIDLPAYFISLFLILYFTRYHNAVYHKLSIFIKATLYLT